MFNQGVNLDEGEKKKKKARESKAVHPEARLEPMNSGPFVDVAELV